MLRWLWMTGGLVVWAGHFTGVYLLASLAAVVAHPDALAWRLAGLGFSLACLIACIALLIAALVQRRRRGGIGHDLAAMSGGLGALAVVFQAAPLVVGY